MDYCWPWAYPHGQLFHFSQHPTWSLFVNHLYLGLSFHFHFPWTLFHSPSSLCFSYIPVLVSLSWSWSRSCCCWPSFHGHIICPDTAGVADRLRRHQGIHRILAYNRTKRPYISVFRFHYLPRDDTFARAHATSALLTTSNVGPVFCCKHQS